MNQNNEELSQGKLCKNQTSSGKIGYLFFLKIFIFVYKGDKNTCMPSNIHKFIVVCHWHISTCFSAALV